ncbi:MAG: fibronectin type III domain-containing protein [Limisphaerales bacterium]
MRNTVKTKPADLIGQAAAIAQGAEELAGAINLGDNNAVNIRADIAALVTAVAALNSGKVELKKRLKKANAITRTHRRFMMQARDTLKPTLGFTYNPAWEATGLVGSLYIPPSRTALLPILGAFRTYLNSKPSAQDAGKGITPTRVKEFYDELDDANGDVNAQITAVGNQLAARNRATKQLRHRLRAVILSLRHLLDPMDMRWETFGLKRPGIKVRPPTPSGVKAVLIGPAAVSVKWNRAPRADHYRVRKMVSGVDQDWVPVGSPADEDITLENLPTEAEVQITVSAVNNGGESAPSEPVVVKFEVLGLGFDVESARSDVTKDAEIASAIHDDIRQESGS